MEFPSKLAFVLLQLISTLKLVSGNYCEWNTCKSWEYCCGDYVCCSNNDVAFNITIITCAVLAMLFLSYTIFLICRYSCRDWRPMIQIVFGNYKNLSRDTESSTTNLATCDIATNDRTYVEDSPPPYSEVIQIAK